MVENRYEYNKEILKKIEQTIENHHELRFIQILFNLNIINTIIDDNGKCSIEDRFYEEPNKTLEKMSLN